MREGVEGRERRPFFEPEEFDVVKSYKSEADITEEIEETNIIVQQYKKTELPPHELRHTALL